MFQANVRKELLKKLMPLPNCNTEKELINNHHELNMSDCCRMVYDAWSSVNNAILKNEWDTPLKHENEQSSEDFEIIKKDIDEELGILNRLPVYGGCDRIAVMN